VKVIFFVFGLLVSLDGLCTQTTEGTASFATSSTPIAIYLTWKEDPTTTMVIQWITPNTDHSSTIQYKVDGEESAWMELSGTEQAFPENQPFCVHVASCTKLLPDTLYRFRLNGYSIEHLFKTMPKDLKKPLQFIMGGDINLSNIALFDETTHQAISHDPAFVLIGGDLACAASKKYKGEKCEKWIMLLSHWYACSQTAAGQLIPLLVAIGNHEVKGGMDQDITQAPFFYTLFSSPGPQGYMTLRFGTYLSIYILDSGHTHPVGGKQTEWLRTEMAKDSTVLHRIALYHIPAYPDVRRYRNNASTAVRRHFVPVFDKYHLHLAFENHEHAYKRTLPLVNSSFDPDGTVYIGDGSWGVPPRSPKKASWTTYLEKTVAARAFSIVTITKSTRTVTAIAYDGTVLDSCTQDVDYVKAIKAFMRDLSLSEGHTNLKLTQ
jgi:acid phosphatase type 7